MVEQQFSIEELANEIWKPVVGYEGVYSVSDLGRVRRDDTGRIRRQYTMPKGYRTVGLSLNGQWRTWLVHRLVATAFIGESHANTPEINHKNGIKADNRPANLEWCSHRYNADHAVRIGLTASGDRHRSRTHPEGISRGDRNGMAKLTAADVREIRCLVARGVAGKDIAQQYRVARSVISRIKHRVRWAHLLS